jgi:uncharacterized protein (DUF427 family)
MIRATWNDTVIAESDRTEVVEGNHYFPMEDVRRELLVDSDTTSTCPWKGEAGYFSIVAGDRTNTDAAWIYRSPKPAAENITGRVAFWKGVEVAEV